MPGESREPDLKLIHWLSRINDHRTSRLNDPILMGGSKPLLTAEFGIHHRLD